MTDLLTQKNIKDVNFQLKKKFVRPPCHVYCEYPPIEFLPAAVLSQASQTHNSRNRLITVF